MKGKLYWEASQCIEVRFIALFHSALHCIVLRIVSQRSGLEDVAVQLGMQMADVCTAARSFITTAAAAAVHPIPYN